MIVNSKVMLNFLHKPVGIVIAIQKPLSINGVIFRDKRFKVQWENEEDGESKWLKEKDLTDLHRGK